MADLGSTSYSEVDASNSASPPDGWPEGMAPSNVNNSARANMGAEKRFWDRINAVKTTAGTTTAYTLTYDVAAAAYYDGELFSFVVNATCGAAPTLNINALGARNLRMWQGASFANAIAGDLLINQIVLARYNLASTAFDVISPAGGVGHTTAINGTFSNTPATQNIITNFTAQSGNGGSWLNLVTGRYTPPGGRYCLTMSLSVQAPGGGNGTCTLGMRKNGTGLAGPAVIGSGSASFSIPMTITAYVDATGTDFFEFYVNPAGAGMSPQGNACFVAFPI